MKFIIYVLVFLLTVSCTDAIRPDQINNSLPYQSITMDEDANITLDGGWLKGFWSGGEVRTCSYAGVIVSLSPWFIPMDIGVAGPGGNDYRVMQAALDYIDNSNYTTTWALHGKVFYPDADLRVPSGIEILGHNATIMADSTNTTLHDSILRDKYPDEVKYRSIQITALKLDGINKTYVNYCLNMSRMQYATIIDVSCDHAKYEGFRIRDDSWGSMFFNCHTYDNGGYGYHFMAGPNDKPNCCEIIGGRIMADDSGGIHIEAGTDIRVAKSSIESTGTAAYILDNASIFDGNYIEACTNGFYWGAGGDTIYGLTLTNNHMYSVTNPATSVSASSGTVYMVGNTVDGVSIDSFIGWSTGTGSVQSIDFPAALKGVPFDVRVWNIETGYTNNPKFFTDETWTCLNITADNGINYRYKVQTGF